MRANRRRWSHPFLVCSVRPRGDDQPTRIGIVVGRRVGKAVVRNRVKRRLREALRALHPQLRSGHDLVFIARPPAAGATVNTLRAIVGDLATRAHLLRPAGAAADPAPEVTAAPDVLP